jgi:protein-S-isoprenylcysteine O-methyltransferase Ste14
MESIRNPQSHLCVWNGSGCRVRPGHPPAGVVAILPAIIVMQTFRARHEARVLEAAFGDAYREYRRNTWF